MGFRETYKTIRKISFEKALNDVLGRCLVKLCVSMFKKAPVKSRDIKPINDRKY